MLPIYLVTDEVNDYFVHFTDEETEAERGEVAQSNNPQAMWMQKPSSLPLHHAEPQAPGPNCQQPAPCG